MRVADLRGVNEDTLYRWSINFSAANTFTYAWSPAVGLSCTDCPNPVATPSVSTTYTVNVADNFGCTHTQNVRVTVQDSLNAPVASVANINYTFIVFGWQALSGASSYQVSINGGPWVAPSGALTHTVFGVKEGDNINFRVRGVSPTGCGARIATINQVAQACVLSIGNGANRRLEIDSIICYGLASPRINFAYTNTDPNFPVTYVIDDTLVSATPIFNDIILAGRHKALVFDASGCRDSLYFTLGQPEPLALDLKVVDLRCNGDTDAKIVANATGGVGGYQYQTFNGFLGALQPEDTLLNISAGLNTIRAEDANGCEITADIDVIDPPLFNVALTKVDINCAGARTGEAAALASGGIAPYRWQWNTGDTTQTIDSLAFGMYDVTVTDNNGCEWTDVISLDESLPLVVDMLQDSVNCFGTATGGASIQAFGGASPYIFTWNNGTITNDGSNFSEITNVNAGNFQVSVSDGLGCVLDTTIAVLQPDSLIIDSLTTLDVRCAGEATGAANIYVSKGSFPFTYEWTAGTQSPTPSVSGLTAGNYQVIVRDANDCPLAIDYEIRSRNQLTINNLVITPVRCFGSANGSISAQAAGGGGRFTYAWSSSPAYPNATFSNNNATISNIGRGLFTLRVTDGDCSIQMDTLVTEPQAVDATILSQVNARCFGSEDGSATPSVSGGVGFANGTNYTYSWNDPRNQTTATATNLAAGTYILTATDGNGCFDTAQVTI
ncbi:MAG: hypothetical protein HC817_05135 [Saprospiraceae bacterium]|nr:hypothetical protein [Saprospiraceae bacterium]